MSEVQAAKEERAAPEPSPQQLARARGDLEAARAVAADPATTSYYVEAHLVRAWRRLVSWIDPVWRYDGRPESLLERVRDGALPWPARAGERARVEATLAALLEGGRHVGADSRGRLAAHMASLEGLLDAIELEGRGGPPARRRARRRARLSSALLWIVPLMPLVLWLSGRALERGRWRVSYWSGPLVEGRPDGVLRAREVKLSLGTDEPSSALAPARDGSDGRLLPVTDDGALTTRWDACLVLEAPGRPVFQLTADGPARLEVDGVTRLELDEVSGVARRRAPRARTSATREGLSLEPGVHHLRVEARALARGHAVALTASLAGELPAAIPSRWLREPSEELLRPCGP
ncbi:MAG: hypothetical protein H6713_17840 [Myxococcales bacterium]|nr:hypothetical protein [Myxococcales bacterium]